MSNFNIGDKIVCHTPIAPLKGGKFYIADGMKKASCCGVLMVDIGMVDIGNHQSCTSCGKSFKSDGTQWFKASRFKNADVEIDAVSEAQSIINKFVKSS